MQQELLVYANCWPRIECRAFLFIWIVLLFFLSLFHFKVRILVTNVLSFFLLHSSEEQNMHKNWQVTPKHGLNKLWNEMLNKHWFICFFIGVLLNTPEKSMEHRFFVIICSAFLWIERHAKSLVIVGCDNQFSMHPILMILFACIGKRERLGEG